MKKVIVATAVFILVIVGLFVFNAYTYTENPADEGLFTDYKTGRYLISGTPMQLGMNGVRYFGNEVLADIDNDGDQDVAFLITQERGEDGVRFFLAGALKEEGGYRGSQAMMIGDNIAPQTTEWRDGLVLINFAERRANEPLTTPPHMGRSIYAKYSPTANDFGEVVQNFEGESANGR